METPSDGSTIADRYRLIQKLGSGGMGSVWLAHDLSLDTRCAVKLVDTDKIASDEARIRFSREAKTAAQLRGAHVVDVFDHGVWEDIPFIAMELLEGEDLATRLARVGRLSLEETYVVIVHVARALVRAHGLGFVHRDLKPENIFLVPSDESEIAKVLDFGIATHEAFSLKDKTTKTGSFVGTPSYMSPEQARGKAIDFRSDLWSLGVIVFQCLTGRTPFESEALGELLGMIMYEPIPKLECDGVSFPVELSEFWERAMMRNREERFQSAREFADEFGKAAQVEKLLFVPNIVPCAHRLSEPPLGPLSISEPTLRFADDAGVPSVAPESIPDAVSEPGAESPVTRDTGAPLSRTRGSLLVPAVRIRSKGFALGAIAVLATISILVSVSFSRQGAKPDAVSRAQVVTEQPAPGLPVPLPDISVVPLDAPVPRTVAASDVERMSSSGASPRKAPPQKDSARPSKIRPRTAPKPVSSAEPARVAVPIPEQSPSPSRAPAPATSAEPVRDYGI